MAIRGFIAASLDGYIADASGGIGWLEPFEAVESGYADFIATIDTVVLGRSTYDQLAGFGRGWPYAGQRGLVVTSRPLPEPFPGVSAWHGGIDALCAHLRSGAAGEAWVAGGARLQAACIAAGALDRLDLFVIPILLGDGVPLFPRVQALPRPLNLRGAETLERGMVRLSYEFS